MFATAGLLTLLLNQTKIGLAFRAVSSNLESSQLVRHPSRSDAPVRLGDRRRGRHARRRVFVADPIRQLDPFVMVRVLIFAASAAALGGLDSLWGAIVGGILIGMVQSLLVPYTPIPNELSLAAAVVVLMIVLLFKPSGLFGTPPVERV